MIFAAGSTTNHRWGDDFGREQTKTVLYSWSIRGEFDVVGDMIRDNFDHYDDFSLHPLEFHRLVGTTDRLVFVYNTHYVIYEIQRQHPVHLELNYISLDTANYYSIDLLNMVEDHVSCFTYRNSDSYTVNHRLRRLLSFDPDHLQFRLVNDDIYQASISYHERIC